MEKLFYSLMEAQIATGVSQWTWRAWAQEGRISFTRGPYKRILIPASEITRIMNERLEPRKEEESRSDSSRKEEKEVVPA